MVSRNSRSRTREIRWTRAREVERARGGEPKRQGEGWRVGGLCSRLGLIQVQRRCRRLYDDEEHLGDQQACNFLVAQTSHLYRSVCGSTRATHTHAHHTRARVARSSAPPVTVAWDQFVSGRGLAVMRLR